MKLSDLTPELVDKGIKRTNDEKDEALSLVVPRAFGRSEAFMRTTNHHAELIILASAELVKVTVESREKQTKFDPNKLEISDEMRADYTLVKSMIRALATQAFLWGMKAEQLSKPFPCTNCGATYPNGAVPESTLCPTCGKLLFYKEMKEA